MAIFLFAGSESGMAQLSPKSIQAAHRYSVANAGIGFIVEERGQVVFEKYYQGHARSTPLHIYSGTKSFFGMLAVIAESEGILSLDEKVAETLPEWRGVSRKSRITLRDLLNFTSGIGTGFEEIYGGGNGDKCAVSVELAAKHDRGESFIYGPSHLQIFCEVLRRKLADRGINYETYLKAKILEPLQIDVTKWRADAAGNVVPSAGMYMTGQDWLHFGQCVVQGGSWKGRQLVAPDRLAKCFQSTEINPAFGLCFWTNRLASAPASREVDVEEWLDMEPLPEDWSNACLSKAAPSDLLCSLGSNFQRLYMVPSMQLVVVHLGKKGKGFRDAEFLRILFQDAVLPQAEAPAQPTPTQKGLPKVFNGFGKRPG